MCTPISDKPMLRLFDGYFILGLLCCLDSKYLCCDGPVEQSRGGFDSYLGGSLFAFPVWWFHTHSSFIFVRNIYIHMCIRIYIHTYTYIYIHIHTYTYIYVHIRTYTYIYIHIHTYTYIYIHIHTYTYIYIHIHTYTYI